MSRKDPEHSGSNPAATCPDRRKALLAIALSPVAAALAGCGGPPPTAPGSSRKSALVVGAGLCGLRILDALRAGGWNARLLEASQRSGGRAYTLRRGLSDGLWAEAGAERIRPNHVRVHDLLRRFHIETLAYTRPQDPYLLEHGGHRLRFKSTAEFPQDVIAGLSETELRGFPGSSHLELARVAGAPAVDDRRTAWEWLKATGMTSSGERWVRAWSPWPIDRVPATTFHRFCMAELEGREGGVTVAGGVDRLPMALAAAHEDRITYGVRVTGVDALDDGGVVTTADGRHHRADRVILALPVSVLQKLPMGRAEEQLRRDLDRHHVENEIKLHLEVPGAAFSGDSGASVAMRTRFPRITWPGPRQGADGARVINMMALKGDVARLQTVLAAGDEAVRRYLESTMPIVARSARRVLWHDFTGDPLAGGAWTWTAEGTPPGGAPLRAGPLILAGSDLSSTPGWMEGALTSAEAVLQALP